MPPRSATWTSLTAAIPWLAQLPPELTDVLDLDELAVPEGTVAWYGETSSAHSAIT
jgi:hypothetical protein